MSSHFPLLRFSSFVSFSKNGDTMWGSYLPAGGKLGLWPCCMLRIKCKCTSDIRISNMVTSLVYCIAALNEKGKPDDLSGISYFLWVCVHL